MQNTKNKSKDVIGSLFNERMVGQNQVKSKFRFWLRAYNGNSVMPITFLTGPKGHGKTEFAKLVHLEIKKIHARKKLPNPLFAEVNCSQFKSPTQFFEELIRPLEGEYAVVLLDECHELPKKVQTALLTPFGSKNNISSVEWRGEKFEFDRNKITFLLATTNPEKVLGTLINRMTAVGFNSYSHEEIKDILKLLIGDNITVDEDILLDIAMSCRKSPRIASMQTFPNLQRIASMNDEFSVTKYNWNDFKEAMGILPLGLGETEAEYLLYLNKQAGGKATNQSISAHLKMDRSTVSKQIQTYLMEADLIYVGDASRRIITPEGRKIAEQLKRGF